MKRLKSSAIREKANYMSVEILLVSLLEVHFVPCRGGEDPAFHQLQEPSGQLLDPEHQQLLDHGLDELRTFFLKKKSYLHLKILQMECYFSKE